MGGSEDTLESLHSCIGAASDLCTKKQTANDGDASPIDVLVDIIISLLENANAFSRTIATQSFTLLSDAIHDSAISLIIAVSSAFVCKVGIVS